MTSTWRQHYTLGIMLMMISFMAGCTLFNKPLGDNPLPPPSPSDNGPFAYALSMYQRGDYTQAAKLFNALSRPNTGDDQYLKAQLGEICCRLMLSASTEDLSTAKKMWKDLKNARAGDIWRVEQILFDPLMDRLLVSVAKPTAMTPEPPKKQNKTELTVLKKKTAQITQLQRQLDAVMAENQILKQKIKALEAIDQNIQKKKTEISAPSE